MINIFFFFFFSLDDNLLSTQLKIGHIPIGWIESSSTEKRKKIFESIQVCVKFNSIKFGKWQNLAPLFKTFPWIVAILFCCVSSSIVHEQKKKPHTNFFNSRSCQVQTLCDRIHSVKQNKKKKQKKKNNLFY